MITMFASGLYCRGDPGRVGSVCHGDNTKPRIAWGSDYAQAMRLINPAASTENLDPGYSERGRRTVQGYHAGLDHFDVRSRGDDPRSDPSLYGLERRLLGTLGICCPSVLRSFATASAIFTMGWNVNSRPTHH